jgi:hypothetical protein
MSKPTANIPRPLVVQPEKINLAGLSINEKRELLKTLEIIRRISTLNPLSAPTPGILRPPHAISPKL